MPLGLAGAGGSSSHLRRDRADRCHIVLCEPGNARRSILCWRPCRWCPLWRRGGVVLLLLSLLSLLMLRLLGRQLWRSCRDRRNSLLLWCGELVRMQRL